MLTKMIHTERCAASPASSREILSVSNQYGGTAGGLGENSSLKCEWQPGTYSEDTDLTCRALLAGYKVKYDDS
jgi:hypothetical protein